MRADLPQSELTKATVDASLTIQFAGQTVHSRDVPFKRIQQGPDAEVKATMPGRPRFPYRSSRIPDDAELPFDSGGGGSDVEAGEGAGRGGNAAR